ncbi:fatty acid synthase [Orussus abietinus]|uniref:fatty acid synthase n=1 Tax=Orussus abietinus TaxID=222816 RepID=UPI0006268F30|nr:fatty acid synthase [Orussus abietinus]
MLNPEITRDNNARNSGNGVVISGIAGRFPDCDNFTKFQENLLTKVDCVKTTTRWDLDHPWIPKRIGQINSLTKFDRVFFGVHEKQIQVMDPSARVMLEITYEAVIDAGINPRELRESSTGVFTGSSYSESEKSSFYKRSAKNGFGLIGASRAMLSNRISFYLGLKGPSINFDSACCSSGNALEEAVQIIQSGVCDAAIVGGSSLALHPYYSLHFYKLGLLSDDGLTRSFDANASGYNRSDGIVAIFLQRANVAKRIYAEIVRISGPHVDCVMKNSVQFPTFEERVKLMEKTLKDSGLSPLDVTYVEADGIAIKEADADEAKAIDLVYNRGRTAPLLIGSVKSNVGYTLASNTLLSVLKVVVAMENGKVPPNLHFEKPPETIEAFKTGRLQVVTDLTPWDGQYAVVNTTSYSGNFVHLILKSHGKRKKRGGQPEDDLPRICVISGRTETIVTETLQELEKKPVDVEMLQLLYDIHHTSLISHMYRGFTILPPRGIPETPKRIVEYYPESPREVWFIFSGMGSQWVAMGESLMRLPIFVEAVKKCDAALKPHGIDIVKILTDKDPNMFDDIVNSFVAIATVQVGLVDLLRSLDINPDFIIGHSVGELGCAYADGCFTAEQMILSALSRGLASKESPLIHGSMAAVGLSFEDVKPLCPPDIDVACHNGVNSSTISGPAESVQKFVAGLKDKGIFAKEVACSNIAYHSRYIAPAGATLLKYLKKVIPKPRQRSSKWISTSVQSSERNTAKAQFSSAEYHTNNLLNPVLFAEVIKQIPANAITIEIAPHGLLQPILRMSLPSNCVNVPLTQRGHKDNIEVLLHALGKMYNAGLQPDFAKLYPTVEYPVSCGTQSLSSLVKWDYLKDWYVEVHTEPKDSTKGEKVFDINLDDENFSFLRNRDIDGNIILPVSAHLNLVWELMNKQQQQIPGEVVIFEDLHVHESNVTMPRNGKLKLTVMIQKGSKMFEVSREKNVIIRGFIQNTTLSVAEYNISDHIGRLEHIDFSEEDIYRELEIRGFHYKKEFRNLRGYSKRSSYGLILWRNNWTTFLEGMIQLYVLVNDARCIQLPSFIKKIVIDLNIHKKAVTQSEEIPVFVNKRCNIISCGGVQIHGLRLTPLNTISESYKKIISEEYRFLPNNDLFVTTKTNAFRHAIHLVAENILSIKTNIVELFEKDKNSETPLSHELYNILGEVQNINFNIGILNCDVLQPIPAELPKNVTPMITSPILEDASLLIIGNVYKYSKKENPSNIRAGNFLLTLVSLKQENDAMRIAKSMGLLLVLKKCLPSEYTMLLFRKRETVVRYKVVEATSLRNDTVNRIVESVKEANVDRIIVVSKENNDIGILINKLRQHTLQKKLRFFDIRDPGPLSISLEDPIYKEQLQLDLIFNVLKPKKSWGTYRSLPLTRQDRIASSWMLHQVLPKDMHTLVWTEGPYHNEYESRGLITVEYCTITSYDVSLATGEVPPESMDTDRQKSLFGLEYSGVDSKGNRIMGIKSQCAQNLILPDPKYCWQIPKEWSLEDAATVPFAYITAYYILNIKLGICSKERVLVNVGNKALSEALINLLIRGNHEVFITCDSEEEGEFIRNNYPSIRDDHLCMSDDFADQVNSVTDGEGADIIICDDENRNSLPYALTCKSEGSRIVIIIDKEEIRFQSVGMAAFFGQTSVFSVIPKELIDVSVNIKESLNIYLSRGIRSGVVKPLRRIVYPHEFAKEAFNSAQSMENKKILLKVRPKKPYADRAVVIPRFHCDKTSSYLIMEGHSVFTMEFIDWLVIRGARRIILTSSKKLENGYRKDRFETWRSYGVTIIVLSDLDLSERQNCKTLIYKATELGPLVGIFDLRRMQTDELFDLILKSTKFLDAETRLSCPRLRYFVICCHSLLSTEDYRTGRWIIPAEHEKAIKLCETRSEETLPGLLVLWNSVYDPVTFENNLSTNFDLASVSKFFAQFDFFLHSSAPAVIFTDYTESEAIEDVSERNISDVTDEAALYKEQLYSQLSGLKLEAFANLREHALTVS